MSNSAYFDPFEYQTNSSQREADINAEVEAERRRIIRESQDLAIRQKVLDEWERKSYGKNELLITFRIKDEVVSDLAARHKMIPAAVATDLEIPWDAISDRFGQLSR